MFRVRPGLVDDLANSVVQPMAARAMAQAIVLTGGVSHPFGQAVPALSDLLAAAGFAPRCSGSVADVVAWLRQDPQALLVVYALRWSMTQHAKYAPDRARWAVDLAQAERDAIAGHVHAGGGLLGVHTASICFDTWPLWRNILGGAWVWGRSSHPPWGQVRTCPHPRHVLTRGLEPWDCSDEVYSDLDLTSGIDVAMWARATPVDAPSAAPLPEQPSLWTHHYGRGRVVYSALGHDRRSLLHPTHGRLLRRAAVWAAGGSDQLLETM